MTGKGVIFTAIKMIFTYMGQVLLFDFQFDLMLNLMKMLQQIKCTSTAQSFVILYELAVNKFSSS